MFASDETMLTSFGNAKLWPLYMFFANEQRDQVREENPGISFGQVGKVLGDKWKALSEKQRQPYEAKAAADKKRYEEEKAKYNVSYGPQNCDRDYC